MINCLLRKPNHWECVKPNHWENEKPLFFLTKLFLRLPIIASSENDVRYGFTLILRLKINDDGERRQNDALE